MQEIWAGFQLIGCVTMIVVGLVAVGLLAIVSPWAAAVVGLLIATWIAYRVLSTQKARDEAGVGGLGGMIAQFERYAGPAPRAEAIPGGWDPIAIHLRAARLTESEADRLGLLFLRQSAQNEALDVLEQRPSSALALIQRLDPDTASSVFGLFTEIGYGAAQPIWDRLVWGPQEELLRQGLPESATRTGALLERRFSDAKAAADEAARAALLTGRAPIEYVAWLNGPWRKVVGDNASMSRAQPPL